MMWDAKLVFRGYIYYHVCTLNCPNQVADTLFFDWAKAGLNLGKNDKNVLILN